MRQIDRRAFLYGLTLGTLGAPMVAEAQPVRKVHRIGWLGAASASEYAQLVGALRQGLNDHGYVEGRNLVIEYRWAENRYERLPGLAAELVRLNVDLIVTHSTPGVLAAKRATSTIPIVMAVAGDAVASGLVADIVRPGGNVTGSTFFFPELNAKRLELLKEAVPRVSRVAVLFNPDNPSARLALKEMTVMAQALGLKLHHVELRQVDELNGAFAAIERAMADALALVEDPVLIAHVKLIANLATSKRLPGIGFKEYAEGGGLIAYAVDLHEMYRRAAIFVDKILKGAKPRELPVEQATKFEVIVNLKTVKALGLTVPHTLLLRANRLIE